MRTVPIRTPVKNLQSWFYLAATILIWVLARLMRPAAGGAELGGIWLPSCPFRALTGVPCPFCGLTTGTVWLARWHWHEAWDSNILSPLVLLLSVALGAYTLLFRLTSGRRLEWQWSACGRRRLWLVGGTLVAASWLVNVFRMLG